MPPPEGERESASKLRADRHYHREQRKLRQFDLSGAVAELRKAEARRKREARADEEEVRTTLCSIVTRVEQLCGWVEDNSYHWLPLSPLQLLSWPSTFGYTGDFGMPFCNGAWAWLVDPQNASPPQLAQVHRWFSNGLVEMHPLDEATGISRWDHARCVKPSCGAVLPLDERRPRYVGERVILWGKNSCAAFRGTADEIKARAASATTCPDYRPLGSCEFAAAYVINRNMYEFEELGAVGDAGYGTYGDNCINSDNLERADAVLKGRSVLAVVTAVHPTDAFVVQSTGWRHPRKFFRLYTGPIR